MRARLAGIQGLGRPRIEQRRARLPLVEHRAVKMSQEPERDRLPLEFRTRDGEIHARWLIQITVQHADRRQTVGGGPLARRKRIRDDAFLRKRPTHDPRDGGSTAAQHCFFPRAVPPEQGERVAADGLLNPRKNVPVMVASNDNGRNRRGGQPLESALQRTGRLEEAVVMVHNVAGQKNGGDLFLNRLFDDPFPHHGGGKTTRLFIC